MRLSSRHVKEATSTSYKPEGSKSFSSFLDELSIPQSLEEILEDHALRGEFKEFLVLHMAAENMEFYEQIENFSSTFENSELISQAKRNELARHIIRTFVLEHSPKWLNLPSAVTENLTMKLLSKNDFDRDTFNAARREVVTLMSSNFFDSFLREKYPKLLSRDFDNDSSVAGTGSINNVLSHPRPSFEAMTESINENMQRKKLTSKKGKNKTTSRGSMIHSTVDNSSSMKIIPPPMGMDTSTKSTVGRRMSSIKSMMRKDISLNASSRSLFFRRKSVIPSKNNSFFQVTDILEEDDDENVKKNI